MAKGVGVINWPPIAAYFVCAPWQWLFGLCPTYWQPKLYWELAAGSWSAVPVLLFGWAYLALLGWLFLRRFERSVNG